MRTEVEDRLATDDDYKSWALRPQWTLVEFLLLTCERQPRNFCDASTEAVKRLPFWPVFKERLELARTYLETDELADEAPPTVYLEWARLVLIDIPLPLRVAVDAFEERAGRREPAKPERIAPTDELGTRERDSLLKLVIGMAVGGYGYDPNASRSPIPAQIATDLQTRGVSLSEDTIRKYLREGAELLPQQDE